MNFYLKNPPLALDFVPFAAKCSAFWCEMQCVLVLNAVRFGAKYLAFWCKMQGKMVQNAGFFLELDKENGIKG